MNPPEPGPSQKKPTELFQLVSQFLPTEFLETLFSLLFWPKSLIVELQGLTGVPWKPIVQLLIITGGMTAATEFLGGPFSEMPAANAIYRIHQKQLASPDLPAKITDFDLVQILGILVDRYPAFRKTFEDGHPLLTELTQKEGYLENDIHRSMSIPGFSSLQYLIESNTEVRNVDHLIKIVGEVNQRYRADLLEQKLKFQQNAFYQRLSENGIVLCATFVLGSLLFLMYRHLEPYAFFFGVSCYFQGMATFFLWACSWLCFMAGTTTLFSYTAGATVSTVLPIVWIVALVPTVLRVRKLPFFLFSVICLAISQLVMWIIISLLFFQIGH